MKHSTRPILRLARVFMAVALFLVTAATARAQFKIGPRVGVAVTKLEFDPRVFDSSNRAAFTAGLQLEFVAPVVGLGVDASIMYLRSEAAYLKSQQLDLAQRDFIDIPVNLKWKIGIPLIGRFFQPYLVAGPSVTLLASTAAIDKALLTHRVQWGWNAGAGVELAGHLQLGASYGLDMSSTKSYLGNISGALGADNVNSRNHFWTITAAWLF